MRHLAAEPEIPSGWEILVVGRSRSSLQGCCCCCSDVLAGRRGSKAALHHISRRRHRRVISALITYMKSKRQSGDPNGTPRVYQTSVTASLERRSMPHETRHINHRPLVVFLSIVHQSRPSPPWTRLQTRFRSPSEPPRVLRGAAARIPIVTTGITKPRWQMINQCAVRQGSC